jgi:hypothetical protein
MHSEDGLLCHIALASPARNSNNTMSYYLQLRPVAVAMLTTNAWPPPLLFLETTKFFNKIQI